MATSRSVVSAHNPASASMDPVEPKLRLAPHTIVHLSVTIVETTSYTMTSATANSTAERVFKYGALNAGTPTKAPTSI